MIKILTQFQSRSVGHNGRMSQFLQPRPSSPEAIQFCYGGIASKRGFHQCLLESCPSTQAHISWLNRGKWMRWSYWNCTPASYSLYRAGACCKAWKKIKTLCCTLWSSSILYMVAVPIAGLFPTVQSDKEKMEKEFISLRQIGSVPQWSLLTRLTHQLCPRADWEWKQATHS